MRYPPVEIFAIGDAVHVRTRYLRSDAADRLEPKFIIHLSDSCITVHDRRKFDRLTLQEIGHSRRTDQIVTLEWMGRP